MSDFKLNLRNKISPYNDRTLGYVLDWDDADNNFINLKGDGLSGITFNGVDTLTFTKRNGISFQIPLTPISGETINQDNKFRFVDLGNWMAGGRGLGEVNIEDAFNTGLNYFLDNTSITVNDDELIIFKISVTIYGNFNTEHRKYYFKNLIGKGEYNPLSDTMIAEDLEIAYKEITFNDVETIENSPNVNIINLGTLPTSDYLTYINTNGDIYDLTDSTKIHYFRFDYDGTDYIYVFDPNGSLYGYDTYGLSLAQFDALDLVLFYDSSAPQVVEEDDIFRGTYSELKSLVDNSQLKIGRTYILTDYVTKYQINGTNSETRQELHTMIGSSGNYTHFTNVPNTIAANGDIITCVYAPPGATITSGQTFTIVVYFNSGFIRLSPVVNNLANVGAIFKFEKQRYPNIPNNITILDQYGKPVIKPGGIINTEVHDDTPYMTMSGINNPSPIMEEIILKAIDVNKFSINAESLTFPGDKLEYDFTDSEILSENDVIIGTRNGFILRRTNSHNSISVDKDWRVQRYRRYRLDDTNWNALLLKKNLSGNINTSGSTIYLSSGVNMCTNTNPTLTTNHRFIASEPYSLNIFNDFAKTVSDPFLSGTTSALSVTLGARFNTFADSNTYMNDINLPLVNFSGTTNGGDFHIFPISNYKATNKITTFKVKTLINTVFLENSQRYGPSNDLFVNSEFGEIYNSTFSTLITLNNKGVINRITNIDNMGIYNYGEINNSILLGYGGITNNGFIKNSTFGVGYIGPGVNEFVQYKISASCFIINSIFGGNRLDEFRLNDLNCNNSLIINKTGSLSTISGKMYLTMYKHNGTTYGCDVRINSFVEQIPSKGYWGYRYDYSTNTNQLYITNFITPKHLIYESIDGALTRTINILTNVQ